MSLLQKIEDDFKEALKKSDSVKVSVLRMAKAAIKNKQIDKGSELSDEEVHNQSSFRRFGRDS